jgi:hypothetical protein
MKRMLIALLALSACAPTQKDYDAQARCESMGQKPGTAAFDRCVTEEHTSTLMEQQRQDYERMKQEQEDWKMRRY